MKPLTNQISNGVNLLPPKEKKEISEEKRFRMFLILETLFLLFLVSLSLVLFLTKIYIARDAQSQVISTPPQFQDLEKEIQTINQTLLELHSFYQNQPDYTSLMEKIFQVFPDDVYLTRLSFVPPAVSLQGHSPTREILYGLMKNLEKDASFKDVYFPPSNWVKPTEIDFSVNFQIQPY